MPEVHICYTKRAFLGRPSSAADRGRKLVELVQRECAERFSVDERVIGPEAFSVYGKLVSGWSTQSHDVIVRVTLHHYQERVINGDDNARGLGEAVSAFLNSQELVMLRGRLSVGVSLVFAEIAFADCSED
jgi:hypothetical protein